MSKYDWITLEKEYTTYKKYESFSLVEFAREKNIPYNSNFFKHANTWNSKKKRRRERVSKKVDKKLESLQISREVKTVERHYKIWDRFLDIVENALGSSDEFNEMAGIDTKNKTLKSLADIIEKATKGQRCALNLDKDNTGTNDDEESLKAVEDTLEAIKERKVSEVEEEDNDGN